MIFLYFLAAFVALSPACWAQSHAIAMHGEPKYGPGFQHFDYVNPDAPKGGTLNAENGLTRFSVRYMVTHHYYSIEKAKRDFGWTPTVNLAEGIKLTVDALKKDVNIQRQLGTLRAA